MADDPNQIVVENTKPGTSKDYWDASQSDQIEGFAADISYDIGQTVEFKINVNGAVADALPYKIEIFRLGYYGGDGATLVTTIPINADGTVQPDPITDSRGLVDAGNWSVTDSWQIPEEAVSGIYLARLQRLDSNGDPIDGATNQIPFIVRDDTPADGTKSDIVLQTSDTTWQAYNGWAGNNGQVGANFYGDASGTIDHDDVPDPGLGDQDRAYAVSYNRPFITRDGTSPASGAQDYLFGADYAAVYWLEKNGYDVSYISGVDTDRLGADNLIGHKAYISVGHDEYWSGPQRENVEAARDAGVNLLFWSGNEVYWKTRYEPSIDGSNTDYRTLVSYKETWANRNPNAAPADYANIDPSNEWTGTWRDLRFVDSVDANGVHTAIGAEPENTLTGQLFGPDGTGEPGGALDIPASFAGLRVWRDTSVAATGDLDIAPGILGYEWDTSPEDQYRPAGLIKLSETTIPWSAILVDQGNQVQPGTATHNLSLYRDAESNALVFGAGTVFWSWALSNEHDSSPYGGNIANEDIQQFTVNMFADMGIQPGVTDAILASQGLVRATASNDTTPATTTLADLADSVPSFQIVTITGTATDNDGNALTEDGQVAVVEVSVDGGANWRVAEGTANWTFQWRPTAEGTYTIKARAIDDSLNIATITPSQESVTVTAAIPPDSYSVFDPLAPVPGVSFNENNTIELGMKFTADRAGEITELRYYRSASDAGDADVREGHLWRASDGALLGTVIFTSDQGESGWQIQSLAAPVAILPGVEYIVSYRTADNYFADNGFFAPSNEVAFDGIDDDAFTDAFGVLSAPQNSVIGDAGLNGNGAYRPSSPGDTGPVMPNQTYQSSNYWADVTFVPAETGPNTSPTITSNGGGPTASVNVAENTTVVTTFSAADAEAPPQVLTYVLSGEDAELFQIVGGQIRFVNAPNFEDLPDDGATDGYQVTLEVSDGEGGADSQDLTVNITDVNENPVAGFDGKDLRVDYVFGGEPGVPASFAGSTKFIAASAAPNTLDVPNIPDPAEIGNGPFGLATVDFGTASVRIEYPLDATVFPGEVVNFAAENDKPYNGVLIRDTTNTLPPILGVTISQQAGFTIPLDSGNITFTPDSIFVNVNDLGDGIVSTNSRQTDVDPVATGRQPSFFTLDINFNAPVAVNDTLSATEDTPVTYTAAQLLGNDTDVENSALSIASVTNGTGGTAVLNTVDGTVTFTPTANFTGAADFTYTATDGTAESAPATVTVNVAPVNDVPVAVNDTLSATEDTPVTYTAAQLLGNDTDVENSALSIASVTNGTGGTAVLNTVDGTVTFTPTANFTGAADFTYTATDGTAESAPATVTVNVAPVNDVPVAVNDTLSATEDTPVTYTAAQLLGNDTDVENSALSIASVTNGTGGTAVLNTVDGTVTFTPTANFTGAADFTYTATDGTAESAPATVTVNVAPVNDVPVAVNDTLSATEDTPVTYTAAQLLGNDTDVENSALSIASVTNGTGGTAVLNTVDGTVTFTPTANFTGAADFTYTATDGTAESAPATVTVNVAPVNDVPVAVNDTLSATEDTPVTYTAAQLLGNDTDVDGPNSALSIASVTSGAGGTAELNVDGTVTFTPTANFTGAADFSYTVTDQAPLSNALVSGLGGSSGFGESTFAPADEAQQSVSLTPIFANGINFFGNNYTSVTVDNNGIIYFGSGLSVSAGRDQYSFYNDPAGPPADPDAGALQSWQTGPITGALSPVIAPFWADVDTRGATSVSSGGNSTGTNHVYWDVDPTNHVLTVTWDDAGGFSAGSVPNAYQLQLIDVGNGDFDIVFRYEDITWTKGSGYTINASAGFSGGDGTFFQLPGTGVGGDDTAVATLDTTPGNTGVPGVWEWQVRGGVVVTPSGATSAPATVTVNVAPVNDVPVAVNDTLSATEDTPVTYTAAQLLGNDTDVENSALSIASVTNGTGGTAVLNTVDGTVTFTPTANFTGAADFTYTATDGTAESAPATVTVNVAPVNDVPVAVNDTLSATEDTPVTYTAAQLLGNDTDVENSALSIASVTNGTGGTAVLNTVDGTVTFTPTANFTGAADFTYTATDGTAESAPATVTVNVAPVNDVPVAVNDTLSATEDTPVTYTAAQLLGNDTDVENSALSIASVTNGTGGTAVLNTVDGTVTFTPTANFTGAADFTYTATDGTAESAPATVTVNVAPVNDVPVAVNDTLSATEDTPVTYTAAQLLGNDTDVENSALSIASVTNGTGGTAVLNTVDGTVTFTPTANFTGAADFTYTATDGTAESAPATVTVNVAPVNDVPVAVNDTLSATEDTPVTYTAAQLLGNDTDVDGPNSALSIASVTSGAGGTAELNVDGTVTFTPTANFTGAADFSYTVTDQAPLSNALVSGLGGSSGFGESTFAPADEAQQSVSLTPIFANGINFFGNNYTSVTVDNNGIIYFGSGLSVSAGRDQYSFYNDPAGPPADPDAGALQSWQTGPITGALSPVIAPFWADVDTRGATSVSSGGNSTGTNHVYWDVDPTNHVLTVTWDDAGGFSAGSVPNAYQLQLIDVGNGDFDIVFRYEDITWTKGSGYTINASAGFSGGDGTFFQLPGTGVGGDDTAVATLDTTPGNTGVPGVWEWQVRDGVVVTPSGATSAPATVTVNVAPVNDAPEITSVSTFSVAENTTAVGTVTATDADSASVTFSISGGADASLFNIDANTGALTFVAARDYETQAHSYAVQVTASDGTNPTSQDITVNLTDANDNAPEITSVSTFSVAENTTAVGTVTATDADSASVTFSISGGADASLFNIDANTGALTFVAARDYETQAHSYAVQVTASDGTNPTSQDITVNLTDANDNAPEITSVSTFSVAENTTAVGTVTATDADSASVTFSISGGADASLFNIDANTGALTFVAARDYETQAHSYAVQVTASDGTNPTSQDITVNLTDANDNAPEITSVSTFSVAENTTAVGTVTATDADSASVTFSISGGADASLFNIDANTGALTFVAARDYETQAHSYAVQVTASDGTNPTSQDITVNLTDANDNAPEITSVSTFSVAENTTAVGTVTATDADSASVTFSISGGADASLFNIDANTGALTFVAARDYETQAHSYAVQVTASDGTNPTSQDITVNLTDANDNAPEITSVSTFSVAENTTAVGTVTATDADSASVTFSISGGADASLFNIDANTGALTFVAARDYETQAHSYAVQVTASDGTNPTSQDITVNLTDANDNAPEITSVSTFSVAENTTAVGTVTATDADSASVTFSISGGADASLFNIDANTGALTFVAARDYETQAHSYAVQVTASDGTNPTSQDITVNLTDVNDSLDTSPPTVTSIDTSGSGISAGTGDLNAGHIVALTVNFSENVTVDGGIPSLTLNDGATAVYIGGSGSSALTFSYTVGAGENTPDLTVASLDVNGATIKDAAGNSADLSGAAMNPAGTLQIDTAAPSVAVSIDDSTLNATETTTVHFSFSEDVTGFDATDVNVVGASLSNLTQVDAFHWDATVIPNAGTQTNVASVAVIAGSYTDLAGNPGQAGGTGNFTVDTVAPTVSSVSYGANDGTLRAGETVMLIVALSEIVTVAEGTPTLALNDGGTATYVSGSGSNTLTFSHTVLAGQSTSDLAVTAFNLNGATLDAAGNNANLSGAITNPSGTLVVDTIAPLTPTGLDLAAADDTGTSNSDNLTNNTSALTISGSGQSAATVTLFDDSNNNGLKDGAEATLATRVVAGGTFSADISLSAGTHHVRAFQTDSAGNVSGNSSALDVVVDTSAAAPTGLDLVAADDTGSSNSDNITKNTSALTISGFAENGATVAIFDDVNNNGTQGGSERTLGTTTTSGGSFSLDVSLATGVHHIRAFQVDAAGNTSASSAFLDITVDASATAPTGLDLTAADDTGSSSSDNITKNTSGLTIGGSGENGATVTLFDDTNNNGVKDGAEVALATASGIFSTDISLSAGTHHVRAFQTDLAGNVSGGSGALNITVDTTAPVSTLASQVLNGNGKVTLTGTAGEANDTITIYDGATLGTTTSAANGTWSFTTASKVTDTAHTYTATATDAAGNIGASSNVAILGSSGNDPSLVGTSGNDLINGQGGSDILTGGAGNDTFVFKTLQESSIAAPDRITDFAVGDKIDLSAIDANTGAAGNQAFHMGDGGDLAGDIVATYASATNITTVNLYVNNDATVDSTLLLTGDHLNLTLGDFVA